LIQWWVLLFLLGLLCGYGVGRRQGKEEGRHEGVALAPLEMREKALLEGKCPLCGSHGTPVACGNPPRRLNMV